MARIGKIARLPDHIRTELNNRLRGGESGPKILAWLASVPDVASVLVDVFDGKPINAENLSAWRLGGYADWLEKQDSHWQRIERTRELAAMSMALASAGGGNLSEGAATILGGAILEVLEQLDDLRTADLTPEAAHLAVITESIDGLVKSVSTLRRGDHDKEILRQNNERLRQKDQELSLARERFQRDTAEAVLKSAKDDAVQHIASMPLDHSVQLEAVGKHLFGDLWK